MPKMNDHARPEKIGSSVITTEPSIAALAVSSDGPEAHRARFEDCLFTDSVRAPGRDG